MELRHLRYFVMVAQERHFTRAAARLNIQQPPLSQQIRALERELGFDLFQRHAKGVDLTPAGEVFLREALDILQRVEQGVEKASRTAQGLSGQISLGFTSSVAAHPLIPEIIRQYRMRFPSVEVLLREGNAGELTDLVEAGLIDVGLLRAPVSRPGSLAFHRLLNEPLLLALPSGHPALHAGDDDQSGIPLSALADDAFILVRRPGAPGMYANLLVACRNAGFEPKVAFEVERMLTNLSLVAAGAGVSVVPASMRAFHADHVAYRPLRDARPHLSAPVTALCRRHVPTVQTEHFIALSREIARQHRKASAERRAHP